MSELIIDLQQPDDALRNEWLLTNALGGYAMGTPLGVNRRRYHGLLVAATSPPVGRIVVLHSLMEQVAIGEHVIDLSAQQFGDPPRLHPDGARAMRRFRLDHETNRATWEYEIAGVRLIKELTLVRCANEVRIAYRLVGSSAPVLLSIRPMTPVRDFHELVDEDADTTATCSIEGDTLRLEAIAAAAAITCSHGVWRADPQWWRDLRYVEDRDRGQAWAEDVWSPGVLTARLDADHPAVELRVTTTVGAAPPAEVDPEEPADDPVTLRLSRAASQFVVQRKHDGGWATSVIAGYPWFADWGRDAMISLPGLLLCRGRVTEAKSLCRTFARHVRNGVIPNRFDDYDGRPHYNSVDAGLWFIHAVWETRRTSGGGDMDDLVQTCAAIVDAYQRGTDDSIGVDDDSLLRAGDADSQLTWMDAARGGVVFTPRHGKAVEINALWHHAQLCLADMLPPREAELRERAAAIAESFTQQFWWEERDCCHDVLEQRAGEWVGDGRLRPNQIFAVSLPHSPLDQSKQRQVFDAVRRHLLTPFGLRTLEPAHPEYRPRYEGDLVERDAAYHNGTVWPWLIGPYAEAMLRLGDFDDASRRGAEAAIAPLIESLDSGCIGQIAEVYDGDPPHTPSGCPAQAWSVAEVLRIREGTKARRHEATRAKTQATNDAR